jgi:hypothetical protein
VWIGLTDNYLRVFARDARGNLGDGQITDVRLEQLAEFGIVGALAEPVLALGPA